MAKRKKSDNDMKKYFSDKSYRNKKKSAGFFKKRKTKLIFLSVIAALFLAFVIYIVSGLPSLEQLENPSPQLASKVFTTDGELLGQFYIENRIETDIDSLPPYVTQALIATEDRDFYSHWGVNLSRFVKAMIKNVFTFSREGASTITQQLAKNLYDLKSSHETLFGTGIRKIREWITAIQIEKNFTKKEILELYLNVSYFGKSAYGIESASEVYFGKKASELTLPEAALFIALLKSPEHYDPVRRVENAIARRNLVMHNMVVTGDLSKDEYDKLKLQPITLASEKIGGNTSEAPHFMEYIRQKLSSVSDKYGYDLYRDGLNIYTSIDMRMQKIANKVVSKHLAEYQILFDKNWSWKKNQDVLTVLVDKAIKSNREYRSATDKDEKARIYINLKYNQGLY